MSDEDNSWVLDSLVCFLNGPIWNAPLQSFIEEKSLVFEPIEPNMEEYSKVFEEFKTLVDFMLGSFMEDIGISPEQFHNACSEGSQHISFNNRLFEQIWAANDFDMFTRMMTQKNVELQLEALDLIEKKYGITPEIFIPKKQKNHSESSGLESTSASSRRIPLISPDNERTTPVENLVEIPEERIENKKTEQGETSTNDKITNANQSTGKMEANIMEEVTKKFSEDESSTSVIQQIQEVIEQKPVLETKLKEILAAPSEHVDKSETIETLAVTPKIANIKIDEFELKKRQQYLRSQRDKLVALKKEARQKQLATDLKSTNLKQRPKSAKAAEAVLTGTKPIKNVENEQLEIRKSLAKRLKAEVVDKN